MIRLLRFGIGGVVGFLVDSGVLYALMAAGLGLHQVLLNVVFANLRLTGDGTALASTAGTQLKLCS